MSGQLDFDGKGLLDINRGVGVSRDLFWSPITRFQASHPGIVSFSPELNAQISLIGSGEIDGKFRLALKQVQQIPSKPMLLQGSVPLRELLLTMFSKTQPPVIYLLANPLSIPSSP